MLPEAPRRLRRSSAAAGRNILALAPTVISATAAIAAPPAGSVTRLQGAATATIAGSAVALSPGSDVFAGENVATGGGARLEITLTDETKLTLDENAHLALDSFVFDPAATTRIGLSVNGAFRYVSGKLGVGATRVAEVTTPFATLGARGTDFWGGPVDGHFGVVVLEGTVTASHRGRTVILRQPNNGTDFDSIGAAPGLAHAWARPKIDRAIATVTFR
jgi:hypothetical protein